MARGCVELPGVDCTGIVWSGLVCGTEGETVGDQRERQRPMLRGIRLVASATAKTLLSAVRSTWYCEKNCAFQRPQAGRHNVYVQWQVEARQSVQSIAQAVAASKLQPYTRAAYLSFPY